MFWVPVVDKNQKPLMPTTRFRARSWVKSGKATPFFCNGIYCVRLNVKSSGRKRQQIAIGIDTGSKREAFTVKSRAHTFLNLLVDAVTWVRKNVEVRSGARRTRRQRKTPYRQNRNNRNRGKSFLPPSTKARWQLKLRVINKLRRLFHITDYVVEDVCAVTKKGQRRWNESFSPLEVGKKWFYSELEKLGNLTLIMGYETKELRDAYCLKKLKEKLSDSFYSHNVDSWVLANSVVSGHNNPDNIEVKKMIPIRFKRRQLHYFNFDKYGRRKRYGGTMSLGLKRGSLVKHLKHGLCYVGGNTNNKVSLHKLKDGVRFRQGKTEEIKFLAYNSFR